MDNTDKVKPSGILVEILLPDAWFKRPYYKLLKPISIAGINIPANFKTDGATSPRILWSIFPPIGKYFKATIAHDYLLQTNHTRKYADFKFLEALNELGIISWRKNLMFYTVRLYGIFVNIFS